jgi:hypothetical protein
MEVVCYKTILLLCKVSFVHAVKAYREVEVKLHSFLTLGLDGVRRHLHPNVSVLPKKGSQLFII